MFSGHSEMQEHPEELDGLRLSHVYSLDPHRPREIRRHRWTGREGASSSTSGLGTATASTAVASCCCTSTTACTAGAAFSFSFTLLPLLLLLRSAATIASSAYRCLVASLTPFRGKVVSGFLELGRPILLSCASRYRGSLHNRFIASEIF